MTGQLRNNMQRCPRNNNKQTKKTKWEQQQQKHQMKNGSKENDYKIGFFMRFIN